MKKLKPVTYRLPTDLLARVDKAANRRRNPYAPTKTSLVERGLELALCELEKKRG